MKAGAKSVQGQKAKYSVLAKVRCCPNNRRAVTVRHVRFVQPILDIDRTMRKSWQLVGEIVRVLFTLRLSRRPQSTRQIRADLSRKDTGKPTGSKSANN